MANRHPLKWSPAVLIKRPDNIVSSQAREKNDYGFKPTYDTEPTSMNFIMSNEYLRKWMKERDAYEKEMYSTAAQIVQLKRRFVQKMMTYKLPTKADLVEDKIVAKRREIELKRSKKTANAAPKPDYTKIKYKTQCLQTKVKSKGKAVKKADSTTETNSETGDCC